MTMTDVPVTGAGATDVDRLAVDTLRFLAADMVEQAQSGHPGMPMGAAPMAWALFSRHLKHDPAASDWADRDRFVLSAGHGSALLYALLHLFGYDLPMEQLQQFRRLGSATPGHPELGQTDGVETTTGPLGQGLATAVGMAVAERMLAARYPDITDHHTYVIVGDGCLMEGVSHEAASLAGHLGLGRLVVLYDDNEITIDGGTSQSCSDDALARFSSYGWHVQRVDDGTDVDAVDAAISRAKLEPRPSFISVRTVIGHGAPGVEGTPKAHGAPLGGDVLAAAKARAGWPQEPFTVPDAVRAHCAALAAEGAARHAAWRTDLAVYEAARPEQAAAWHRAQAGVLPEDLEAVLAGVERGAERATRQSSQAVLRALTEAMPELVGGSADLAGSTGTATGRPAVSAGDFSGSVLNFGVREFAMAAVLNGLSLHGGFRPYGSTFLVFSDYLRPALRLSALMGQPVIYVLTHDSVAVGEDGPTHQPVEHVESLRMIPGVQVLRPADDHETVAAWRAALEYADGPTVLVLTRQAVPSLDTPATGPRFLTEYGARVVVAQEVPEVDLLATGSEVGLAVGAAALLDGRGVAARVISVPWRERFVARRETFGTVPLTVSVEAGVGVGWRGVAHGAQVGIDEFGASGPGDTVLAHFGFTPQAVADRVHALVRARKDATVSSPLAQ
jgi:transketolase